MNRIADHVSSSYHHTEWGHVCTDRRTFWFHNIPSTERRSLRMPLYLPSADTLHVINTVSSPIITNLFCGLTFHSEYYFASFVGWTPLDLSKRCVGEDEALSEYTEYTNQLQAVLSMQNTPPEEPHRSWY